MGRRKLIETPEALWNYFLEYKEWVSNNPLLIEDYVGKDADRVLREKPRALTLEGFECYLFDKGIISDLSQYFANTEQRYTDYQTICSHIRKTIRANQIEGGMAGIYNPSITQRLNGLVEKQEQKVEVIKPIIIDWSNDEQ
jgi:hypothetical protein